MPSREYPSSPLVGVGVLVRNGGKVLLVKRRFEPDKGLWALPGGLVKLGEKVRDAAVREIEEETGIKIRIKRLIDVVDKIVLDDSGSVKYHFVIVDFEGEPIDGELRADPEVEDARWVEVDELSKMPLSETTRDLLARAGVLRDEGLKS
ncbi:MAG: hypothetical protein DRJ62_07785 [Thermoprotei archaeon]|nr:MAG: hypothetical protein DRJ62_07785 [Thermoprotei archaeon]